METNRILRTLCKSAKTLFQVVPFVFKKAKEGTAKVIIRFDDYGVWCNSDWITIEEEVIRLHEKYGVKISFGVVPDSRYPLIGHPLSPTVYPKHYEDTECNRFPLAKGSRRVEILKESVKKGIAEVAMHGYTHPKGYSNYNNTEFYGIPYESQYYKLDQGKKVLEGLFECEVSTFIPPHNTYDNLTLDLLLELGYKCISAKYIGEVSPRHDGLGLHYLWFRYDNLSSLKKALFQKRHFAYEPINIIMLHHTNFTKNGKIDIEKLKEYESFLKLIRDNNIDNYCFSDVPDSEIHIFDTTYYMERDNILLRAIRKYWPSVARNFIEYNVNKR